MADKTKKETQTPEEQYLVPSLGVVVSATSVEEAVKKAEALTKKDN